MSRFSMTARLAKRVEGRPISPSPVSLSIPSVDVPYDEQEPDEITHAEGQSFVIEYIDAQGQRSTRRISVHRLVAAGNGIPSLVARCHERAAIRQFRVDRIVCCIDFDGVIHDDVPRFLHDTFGLAFSQAAARPEAEEDRWHQVYRIIWPDAALLSAMVRADDQVRIVEIEAATAYLSALVERAAFMLRDDEIQHIARYTRRLRPSVQALDTALEIIHAAGFERVRRFLRAAKDVVLADGYEHPDEIALLQEFAFELTGIDLTL